MDNEDKKELPIWKRIKQGDKFPCQSFLRKYDGEILRLTTTGGVTVGQDCFYLPVDEVINVIKDYPVEESEDEKIGKEIIAFLKENLETGTADETWSMSGLKRWIAWLEKQGEKKHQYNSRPRYVGEGELLGKKESTVFSGDDGIRKPILDIEIPFGAKDSELEEDTYYIPKGYHAEIEDNKVVIKKDKQKLVKCVFSNDNYTNEERKVLCDGCKVECELKRKPAEWSEEDDQYLLVCKNALAKYQVSDKWDATIISRWLEDKLKSLRPQSHLKPSVEQIEALEHFVRSIGESGYASPYDNNTKLLYSLLADLKKLREE